MKTLDERALPYLPTLLAQWLPDGQQRGREWVALNPTRHDRSPGSFSINMHSGAWADFATNEKGYGALALFQYLTGVDAEKATVELDAMLHGLEVGGDKRRRENGSAGRLRIARVNGIRATLRRLRRVKGTLADVAPFSTGQVLKGTNHVETPTSTRTRRPRKTTTLHA